MYACYHFVPSEDFEHYRFLDDLAVEFSTLDPADL
jgi:hypothetical protein